MLTTIQSLAPEIILHIIHFGSNLPEHLLDERSRRAFLRNTALVCRDWRYASQYDLQRSVKFGILDRPGDFISTVDERGQCKTEEILFCRRSSEDVVKVLRATAIRKMTFQSMLALDVEALSLDSLVGE